MPGKYAYENPHLNLLRDGISSVLKIVGERKGLTDLDYEKYKALTDDKKHEIDTEIENEMNNYQDESKRDTMDIRIRSALSSIANSAMINDKDKPKDVEGFWNFVKEIDLPVKKEKDEPDKDGKGATDGSGSKPTDSPKPASEKESTEKDDKDKIGAPVGSSPVSGRTPLVSSISEGGKHEERVFPGYDKKLTFFSAIGKAYKERKEATDSYVLGALSGLRAAFCKAGPAVSVAMLLAAAVPGGFFLASGTPYFAQLAINVLGTLGGLHLAGTAWQKLEDGKVNHGLVGNIKKLFKKKEKTTTKSEGKHAKSLGEAPKTITDGKTDGKEATKTVTTTPAAPKLGDPKSGPVVSEGDKPKVEEPPVAPVPSEKKENKELSYSELSEIIENLENESKRISEAESKGIPLTFAEKEKLKNIELGLRQLEDKRRRLIPVDNMDITSLAEALEEEEASLEFWKDQDEREDALRATLERIKELKIKIHSFSNTETLAELALTQVKKSEEAEKRKYPDIASRLDAENEFLKELLLRNNNTEVLSSLRRGDDPFPSDYFSDADDLDGISESSIEFNLNLPTPINDDIRLQELEAGKRLARLAREVELIERYDEEIEEIEKRKKAGVSSSVEDYARRRIAELLQAEKTVIEQAEKKKKSISDDDKKAKAAIEGKAKELVANFDAEISILRRKYSKTDYNAFVNAANWGVSFATPHAEKVEEEDLGGKGK